MKSKLVASTNGERTFALLLEPGEEAFAAISAFSWQAKLAGACVTGVGSLQRATIGWFDLKKKTYKPIEISRPCEALSLSGGVAAGDDGQRSLHLHAVIGLPDGTTRGGHLIRAVVWPTLELTVVEVPRLARRMERLDHGTALLKLA